MAQADEAPASRFERLKAYLAADPGNLTLMADAADAAMNEGRFADVIDMVDRHAAIAPPPPSLINVLGLCALAEGRHEDAAGIFAALLAGAPDDPALRFNLAWAREQAGDHRGALEAIGSSAGTGTAAALVVRSLHNLGQLDEAIAVGDAWEGREGSPELWGGLAAVALDAEDLDRAQRWASRGIASPDGLAAQGVLEMMEARNGEARRLFEEALALRPDSGRGLLGMGSVLLDEGRPEEAAKQFDAAGEIYGDHLGTWVAAGWAWLLAGDQAAARARFDRAVAIDDSFGEGHGGLAVIDMMEGHIEDATRRSEIALRLDRQGLGGTLARSLLLDRAGETTAAARIREMALNAPIGPNGRSVMQMLALRAAQGGR